MRVLAWVVVGCLVVGGALPVSAQEAGTIPEEAKSYFQNGVDLLNDRVPNYQDAFVQFKLAYEKSHKSWKVLGNLGLCALKLERDGEALAYYREYLSRGGAAIDPQERAAIHRDLLLLEASLTTVVVAGAGVTQVVDTRQGSTAPAQVYEVKGGEATLSLRAGTHTLTASTATGATERWEVVLAPRQSQRRVFFQAPALVTPPARGSVATPTSAAPPSASGGGARTGAYVALGVGGVGLLAGTLFGVMAKSAESSGNEQCRGSLCPERARADFDSAKSKALWSNVGFGVGLIGLGAGGTLLVLSKSKTQEAKLSTLPGGAGLVWEGSL